MLIDNRIWLRHSITHWRGNSVESIVVRWSERIGLLKYDWWIANNWDADSLEYYITKNIRDVSPSEHLLSLHPSVFWISKSNQMKQISKSIESIVIQGEVGMREKSFNLSSLHSLITVEMGCEAFNECHSVVFESMNDWMTEWMRSNSTSIHHSWISGS